MTLCLTTPRTYKGIANCMGKACNRYCSETISDKDLGLFANVLGSLRGSTNLFMLKGPDAPLSSYYP